jgi:hypothetical protein
MGLLFSQHPSAIMNIWLGAALASSPGFEIGAYLQSRARSRSLRENHVMGRRFALMALLMTVVAIAMLVLGFGRLR